MTNRWFILRLAGMAVLLFPAGAGAVFAQQDGPLPTGPVAQAPAPSTPVQNPSGTPQPSDGSQTSAAPPAPTNATAPAAIPANAKIEVPGGTHIPLVLHNAISTRSARPGDPVYFETLFPIMIDGRVAIPAGSYVSGEVTETKRAGRVKGRAELMIKLNTLILTNGYMVNLNAVPRSAGTGGGEKVDNEGKVVGDSNKAGDVGTVAKTTAAGAGIGGLATRGAQGVGSGAGVGAAAGLMAVLLTRGPDAELPRGTTVDVTLNRPILLDAEKDQFTGPGQASTLAGPQNRESQHGKIF